MSNFNKPTKLDPSDMMGEIVLMDDGLVLPKDEHGVAVYKVDRTMAKNVQEEYYKREGVNYSTAKKVKDAEKAFNKDFYKHNISLIKDIWGEHDIPKVETRVPTIGGEIIIRTNRDGTIRTGIGKDSKEIPSVTSQFILRNQTGITTTLKKEIRGQLNSILDNLSS